MRGAPRRRDRRSRRPRRRCSALQIRRFAETTLRGEGAAARRRGDRLVEQRIDALRGRLPDHALVQHGAQLAQRPEDLVPAIRMISSASRLISPCATRQAPSASAAAAPKAMPRSVMPRVRMLVPSTQIVLSDSARALSASFRPYAPLWPNAFSVGRPCIASRNSSPNALNALLPRARRARRFCLCNSAGATSANSAAPA